MKLLTFACTFLFVISLEGCAATPHPYHITVPLETSSKLKRIAVVSMAARTFYKVEIDKPVARYEEKDISAWGIDKIFEQQIAAEVQNTLGMNTVSAPDSIPDLSPVNANQVVMEDRPDWRAINEAVLRYCAANSLDAILAVSRDNSNFRANSELIRHAGTGMYVYGGKMPAMFLIANMALLDCKTGEPLAARFIDPPEHRLADELSSLSITQWSDQQSKEMKAELVSMPRSSWAQALRSMFLSQDQRMDIERVEGVVSLVKRAYIDDVSEDKLVTGCRDGMARGLGAASDSIQPIAHDSENAKSATPNIQGILAAVRRQFPQIYQEKKLATECIKGMVDTLDPPASAYLDNVASGPAIDPKVAYIGVSIELKDDSARIAKVYEDTPAEKAGLKAGDIIIKVDSTETRGRSINEITRDIQGKAGTTARLAIQREGIKDPIEFLITRETFKPESVAWQSLAPGYSYIRIRQFDTSTTRLFVQAMRNLYLENDGKLKGLVLDLRNNAGGLLTGSIAISAAFLPAGTLIANAAGREADSNKRLTASPGDYMTGTYMGEKNDPLKDLPEDAKTVPMVVLVNKDTASGAEIVAAALQDNKRARLVGTRTYGMGKIATLFPLTNNAALKLASAKLYRPGGKTIHEQGVTPDVKVEAPRLTTAGFRTKDDVQLIQAVKQLGGTVALFK